MDYPSARPALTCHVMPTRAPRVASPIAVALPIPPVPPVIKTTWAVSQSWVVAVSPPAAIWSTAITTLPRGCPRSTCSTA